MLRELTIEEIGFVAGGDVGDANAGWNDLATSLATLGGAAFGLGMFAAEIPGVGLGLMLAGGAMLGISAGISLAGFMLNHSNQVVSLNDGLVQSSNITGMVFADGTTATTAGLQGLMFANGQSIGFSDGGNGNVGEFGGG